MAFDKGAEIANAYVALGVRMENVQRDIEAELGKVDGDAAGGKIGDGVGRGITNKQAAIAGAVGGIVASVANSAATALGDMIGDAVDMSDATDKFRSTLDFAGLDTSAIDEAQKASRDYADSTVYDLSTIQNTTAQLAANGIDEYTELTEAAGNLNAVAGGNAETFSSVAMMLSQTAGAGKLTTENWNQLADAIPGASGRLQEALSEAGAYTGNFRDAMAEGQITADEFNAALLELGTEPVAEEAATSVTTMEGAVGNLTATITGGLADAFTVIKPFLTDFISGISDFIANSEVFIPVISGLAAALLVALAPAIWGAVTATWAFTAALLANPLTWVVLAVAALVAAIVALAMNWDTVVAWITEVWGGFLGWLNEVITGFTTWWDETWAGISQGWSDFWDGVAQVAKDIWNNILGWIEGGVNGAIDLINGMTGGIRDAASVIGIEIGEIPHVELPKLAAGATVLPRPGGTAAILAEAGRAESVVDTGLLNKALEVGITGSKNKDRNGPLVVVNPAAGMDETVLGNVVAGKINFALRGA
ncbi:tape measure protein [Microbacterium sp. KNMS]